METSTLDKAEPNWLKEIPLFIGEEGARNKRLVMAWPPGVSQNSHSANNSGSSEPTVTPHKFGFDIFWGKVNSKEDTFPLD